MSNADVVVDIWERKGRLGAMGSSSEREQEVSKAWARRGTRLWAVLGLGAVQTRRSCGDELSMVMDWVL
jgi:hypothetical protein